MIVSDIMLIIPLSLSMNMGPTLGFWGSWSTPLGSLSTALIGMIRTRFCNLHLIPSLRKLSGGLMGRSFGPTSFGSQLAVFPLLTRIPRNSLEALSVIFRFRPIQRSFGLWFLLFVSVQGPQRCSLIARQLLISFKSFAFWVNPRTRGPI